MRKLVIGLALASTAMTAPAYARDGQWYVGVEGGVTIIENTDFDVGANDDAVSVDTDVGYDVGGVVGYDFGPFRLEADVSWREADIDEVSSIIPIRDDASPLHTTSGFNPGRGDVNILAFMLNGLVDLGDDDGLQGSIGGGVGVARTDVHGSVVPADDDFIDSSDTGFAWQVLAAIRAPLTDNIDVGLKYRYFNSDSLNLVDALGNDYDGRVRSHSLLGTLTYNFGAPPPPPPPAVEPPPPPPPPRVEPKPPAPPVCNQGPYVVFFDFDKSDITPQAATILDNAINAYGNCNSVPIMLAGHADRSGSAKYNVGLSERRNAAVRAYLESNGIPGARISTEAFGESRPAVPTADGVRELQNRRVEITYGPGSGY